MRLALVFVALTLSSSLASAQPGMTPPVEPQHVDEKDPSIAVLLSLGIPVAGAITLGASKSEAGTLIGLGAMYFGPSTGQWYAGKAGGLGLGLRAVGAVSMMAGIVQMLDSECDDDTRCSGSGSDGVGAALVIGGAGLWVGSSIADIVLAKRAAEAWNREHTVTLTPGLIGTNTSRVPGLYVTGRF